MLNKKFNLSVLTKMADGTPQERRFFSGMCQKMEQHSPFLQKIWSKPYRLVELDKGRLGIYRNGGGFINSAMPGGVPPQICEAQTSA